MGFSDTVKSFVKTEYGVRQPVDFISAEKNDFRPGEWVLCFKITGSRVSQIYWLCVDHMVKLLNAEKRKRGGYPFEAVQVWPLTRYQPPPFIIDQAFRTAFRKATIEYGVSLIQDLRSTVLPKRLLNAITNYLG